MRRVHARCAANRRTPSQLAVIERLQGGCGPRRATASSRVERRNGSSHGLEVQGPEPRLGAAVASGSRGGMRRTRRTPWTHVHGAQAREVHQVVSATLSVAGARPQFANGDGCGVVATATTADVRHEANLSALQGYPALAEIAALAVLATSCCRARDWAPTEHAAACLLAGRGDEPHPYHLSRHAPRRSAVPRGARAAGCAGRRSAGRRAARASPPAGAGRHSRRRS